MAKRKKNSTRNKEAKKRAVLLYHDMRVHETFEQCAYRLHSIARGAQGRHPGQPRILYLDIQGHRNSAGGYDRDAYEIQKEFMAGYFLEYLTEAYLPLYHIINTKKQRDDFPDELRIEDGEGEPLLRDFNPDQRRSAPSMQAIADYLGLDDDPACMICWSRPVERAHARPVSLGGSHDIRNFALLCRRHHLLAPDVYDSNAFWHWMDWMLDIDHPLARVGHPTRAPLESDFFSAVKRQLKELYGWSESDLGIHNWVDVMDCQYRILSEETGKHFGVDRKSSTHAWAFDQALRRIQNR